MAAQAHMQTALTPLSSPLLSSDAQKVGGREVEGR
jgi:hypothetical protein